MSGISDNKPMPIELLPYDGLLPSKYVSLLFGKVCYIFDKYPLPKYSVLVDVSSDQKTIVFGDENCSKINPGLVLEQFGTIIGTLYEFMKVSGLSRAQFYFSEDEYGLMLVDVRTHSDKFIGPGALRDLFGKALRIAKILAVVPLTADYFASIGAAYPSGCVVKPSKFTNVDTGNCLVPMYIAL